MTNQWLTNKYVEHHRRAAVTCMMQQTNNKKIRQNLSTREHQPHSNNSRRAIILATIAEPCTSLNGFLPQGIKANPINWFRT
jgi:hypothetical protein